MSAPSAAPIASTLGELRFELPAEEVRRRGRATLAGAERDLERLLREARPPTVGGFLRPLDRILLAVRDLSAHGGFLFAVHPEAAVRAAGRELSESADRFVNALRIRPDLYRALGEVPAASLDADGAFALGKLRREMRRAGAERSEEERRAILARTNEVDRLANQFTENIARSRRTVSLRDASRLSGLPADFVAAHRPGGDGSIVLSTDYPDFRPVMAYADDAELRRELLGEFTNRANPENVEVLRQLLAERDRLAGLLGYPTYAAFALEDKMIERPERASAFLERVAERVRAPALAEQAGLLDRKRRDLPSATGLENWDIGLFAEGYYASKVRAESYGVDPRRLRAYFPYPAVRGGLFALCEELFDLEFVPVASEFRWHPTVEIYDVRRRGAAVGRFYLDLVPREGKYSHAACFGVREGLAGVELPQSALVCNFLDPGTDPAEARMEYSDVVTFFHEFGHLLHALLSGGTSWLYNSQNQIEWDFVEAPSQLFEEWARDPATLRRFARDPTTGATIPDELLDRLRASESFGRASRWLRQVALSEASLRLYEGPAPAADPHEVMRRAFGRYAPIPLAPTDHPELAWGHLTGYSAFYYTYVWSVVIARDLLTPFEAPGASLADRAVAARYAREILEAGSRRPAAELVRNFLGRDSDFDAFARWVTARPTAPSAPVAPP